MSDGSCRSGARGGSEADLCPERQGCGVTIEYSTGPVAGPREMALEPPWSCWGRGKNGHSEQGRVRAKTRCPEQDRDKTQWPKRGSSKASHHALGRGIKSHLRRAGVNPGTLCGEGEK